MAADPQILMVVIDEEFYPPNRIDDFVIGSLISFSMTQSSMIQSSMLQQSIIFIQNNFKINWKYYDSIRAVKNQNQAVCASHHQDA